MANGYSRSDKHDSIALRVKELADKAKTIGRLETMLETNKIYYESVNLASGKELLIFTGSSGYDIVGVSVRKAGGQLVVEPMWN